MKQTATARSDTSEALVGVAERIGRTIRSLRIAGDWDQGTVADVMTALGVPTQPATINRIELGKQPVTLEQAMVFALIFDKGGLARLLDPTDGGWAAGSIRVTGRRDLEAMLVGTAKVRPGDPHHQAQDSLRSVPDGRRDRQLASALGVAPERVQAAAKEAFGRSAQAEVARRFHARLEESGTDRPASDSPAWRVMHGHAVRAVQADLEVLLKGEAR